MGTYGAVVQCGNTAHIKSKFDPVLPNELLSQRESKTDSPTLLGA